MPYWQKLSRRKHAVRKGLSLAILVSAISLIALGQSQPDLQAPTRPKLYVAEFNRLSPTRGDLGEFARRLFQLRFRAVPELEVAEDSEIPPCAEATSGAVRSSAPVPVQLPDRPPQPSSVPVFYRIQGTVDEHAGAPAQAQSNILIAYELVKITNCRPTLLLRRTRTFGLAEALQNLEDAAEELNSQLSDDVAAKVAVKVEVIEAVGDPKGTYGARDLLTRFIRQKVADADTFRLWDETSKSQPLYTLKGGAQFTNSGSSGVSVKVQFTVNGNPLQIPFPARTVKPTTEGLIPFYLDAANAAVKGLSDLFYGQRAGLSGISSQGPGAIIERAKQLLCLKPATDYGGCSRDPQAALLALNEIQQNIAPGNRAEVMTLIGRARFQTAEYPAAGEAYDSALSAAPGGTEARLLLLMNAGDAWYEAKEYIKAADHYRECVETGAADPSVPTPMRLQPGARVKLVHSLLLGDKPQAALAALLDGLRAARSSRNPDDESRALYSRLASELQPVLDSLPAKELESAAGTVESELAYDPALEASALNRISRAYASKGRYKEAVVGYRKALALKFNDAEAHYYLGIALDSMEQFDEAISEYRTALRLKPDDAFAHNNLGVALSHKGQFEEAIVEYRTATRLRPEFALAFGNLAASLYAAGQYDDAAETYSKLHELIPEEPQYLANLEMAEIQAGKSSRDRIRMQKAIHRLEQEVSTNPSFWSDFALAWAYSAVPEVRDLDKAAQLYQKALSYRPDDLTTVDNLAALALQKGDSQTFIKQSNKLSKMNPGDPGALENLGYGRFLAGDLRGAIEAYEKALELDPNEPLHRIALGEALLWLPNTARAHQEFARAREALTGPGFSTYIWLMESRYDTTEKQRAVYYATLPQKRALVEQLDALTYLREMQIASALERYRTATGMLTPTQEGDDEVIRKGINDLHRLERESPAQPTAELGLGYLYDWLGETTRADYYWNLYLRSGTDPVGLREARRRLARKTM